MDARSKFLGYILGTLTISDMSQGTATFKYGFVPEIIDPELWGLSQEAIDDIFNEGSLKLLAEAIVFPTELEVFVYDPIKQEAKATY